MITTIEEAKRRVMAHALETYPKENADRSSVALILRESEAGLSLLFIERAEVEGDHWSGHIAFPGGRAIAGDGHPRDTAERESGEEVGLYLDASVYLGRLDDLLGRERGMVISGFVYGLRGEVAVSPNHEVARWLWLPLGEILNPARHLERDFDYMGQALALPAIRVFEEPDRAVLWGLSYRFLEILMDRLGDSIPVMPWRSDL